jgi:hypothetical protein
LQRGQIEVVNANHRRGEADFVLVLDPANVVIACMTAFYTEPIH